jgi:small subunit ribosomal protein S20
LAHHASALKHLRQSLKRQQRNRASLSRIKTQIRRLRAALASKQAAEAGQLLPATVGAIDKAVRKGVVHANAAARYKGRLTRRVNALLAAPPA